MIYSWKTIFRRMLVLLMLLGCVWSVLQQANKRITEYNQNELQRNIQAIIEQNAENLTLLIDKHKTLVESTANRISFYIHSPEELRLFLLRQAASKDVYKFYRLGFIYPDGTAISSDGYLGNLGFREYFQKSMLGQVFITSATNSVLDKKHPPVNIISAPVKNEQGQIIGVIFETIPSSILTDAMSRGAFAEFGSSALINNDGEIVAANSSSRLLKEHGDLLTFATVEASQKHLSVWQQRLNNSANTTTMYFERDGGQYLHFAHIYLERVQEPLHIAVLLRKATITAQTAHFSQQVYNILGILFAIAIAGVLYYFLDIYIQESKRRKELEQIAYVSPTTQGPNYALFKKKLLKYDDSGYLAYMDIHEFEVIRSTVGAAKAQELLKEVWNIVHDELSSKDLGAHLSSDYFAFFFNTNNIEHLKTVFTNLNTRFAALADSRDIPPLVAVFGVVSYNKKDDVDIALSKANIAKQSIAANRNALYAVYGTEFTQAYLEEVELEKSFAKNIELNRFEVWYQPKFDCFTNKIIGAEALVRLRNEQGELVPPYKFIPVFERDGLIRQLDEYVFRTVCQAQKQRLSSGKKIVPISINLSRVSLYYRQIAARYTSIVQEIGLLPELVPLEITESAAANIKDIGLLTQGFCDQGFKLHMDDFGSGYSSLAALNELPFESIKIDKSIIDFIGSKHGNALVKHTILLAKELGMSVTAEGVETQEQLDYLKTLDCHSIQGYFYSKPLEYKAFDRLLHIF